MDKILPFITPGPLKERFKFSTRVFISWISLGLFLGLMSGIGWLIAGMSEATTAFFSFLIALPIITCSFGLIGLGIDSVRRRSSNYQGWYWWLFPIITYFFVSFWLSFGIIFAVFYFVLSLTGVISSKPQQRHPKFNPDQLRKEFPNLKVKDILKDFEKELEQLEQLEEQGKLEPKQKNVVRKLRQFDGSKYNSRLQDVFEDDELEELVVLILILLGVEIK